MSDVVIPLPLNKPPKRRARGGLVITGRVVARGELKANPRHPLAQAFGPADETARVALGRLVLRLAEAGTGSDPSVMVPVENGQAA